MVVLFVEDVGRVVGEVDWAARSGSDVVLEKEEASGDLFDLTLLLLGCGVCRLRVGDDVPERLLLEGRSRPRPSPKRASVDP